MPFDPGLLFGRAEPNPNKVRRQPVNFFNDLAFGRALQFAFDVTFPVECAEELESGVLRLKHFAQFRAARFRAAQQVMSKSGWNDYSALDIQFKEQVVATKRNYNWRPSDTTVEKRWMKEWQKL